MTKDMIKDYTLRITQTSETGLIVVMYDLALDYIKSAKKIYAEGTHAEYRQECMRAVKVIHELMSTLDFNYEISRPLYRIYEYISKEITSCYIKNCTDGLDVASRFMESLRESFDKISLQDEKGPVMGNTQSVYAGLTYGKGVLNENITVDSNRGFTV